VSDLSEAIKLAATVHANQVDKNGEPYILHPLRVMLAQTGEVERVAAVLHDVVEDGDVGHGDVLALFGEDVHAAVFALTRQEGEDYFDYVRRAGVNPISRAVKLADLRDNLRPGAEHLRDRYERAIKMLEAA
jgi:(p)ppGpp synthase/HD superfamily hydrolase